MLGRCPEEPHINDIAGQLAAMLDAFHLYASTLERFRSTCRAATGSPQRQLAALSAIAEEEVSLLCYRAALRTSMQQLIPSWIPTADRADCSASASRRSVTVGTSDAAHSDYSPNRDSRDGATAEIQALPRREARWHEAATKIAAMIRA